MEEREMDDIRPPHRDEAGQKAVDPEDARSATKEGVVRYALIGGLVLVIGLFALIDKAFV
jgi:hypothetical protein